MRSHADLYIPETLRPLIENIKKPGFSNSVYTPQSPLETSNSSIRTGPPTMKAQKSVQSADPKSGCEAAHLLGVWFFRILSSSQIFSPLLGAPDPIFRLQSCKYIKLNTLWVHVGKTIRYPPSTGLVLSDFCLESTKIMLLDHGSILSHGITWGV